MKVIKPGLIHEYKNYDASAHCEAHIACLEKLDPEAGVIVRTKTNELIQKYGNIRGCTTELQRECSAALDKVAPSWSLFWYP